MSLQDEKKRAIALLTWYANPANRPLTLAEIEQMFGTFSPDTLVTLDRYLVASDDELVQVRSVNEINDWQQRHAAQVAANWKALGVSHA